MKAKAAFYFLILCPQFLSLERYRRKKRVEVKVHYRTSPEYKKGNPGFVHFSKLAISQQLKQLRLATLEME
jgi:hypothetical protein